VIAELELVQNGFLRRADAAQDSSYLDPVRFAEPDDLADDGISSVRVAFSLQEWMPRAMAIANGPVNPFVGKRYLRSGEFWGCLRPCPINPG
jgi:hypothetical protein